MRGPALFFAVGMLAVAPYREALPGYVYSFPKDHFEHREFRTEWWYYTGNLYAGDGHRYGFELVFFRQGERRGDAKNPSAWRIEDLYLAHAALTDVTGKNFVSDERLNRSGPGIAGASAAEQRVWNGNWSAAWHGGGQTLTALADGFSFTLEAVPVGQPVIHGVDGVSQKAEGAGHASHYVSFPRLRVRGSVTARGRTQVVTGQAWMDHEWFTHQLAAEQAGWDWFSIQLDSGANVMLYRFRRKDGGLDPYSSGTFIDRQGKATHLAARDFSLRPLEYWHGYPIHWAIEVPGQRLKLECRAALANQELTAAHGGPTYWEGAVDYTGSATGVGYLEMTGYDKPFALE